MKNRQFQKKTKYLLIIVALFMLIDGITTVFGLTNIRGAEETNQLAKILTDINPYLAFVFVALAMILYIGMMELLRMVKLETEGRVFLLIQIYSSNIAIIGNIAVIIESLNKGLWIV